MVVNAHEAQLQTHPFYHIPSVNPDDITSEISWERVAVFRGHQPLNAIYRVLKKTALDKRDVTVLIYESSRLLSFAIHRMDKVLSEKPPSRAVGTAATMLLVLDMLFAAGSALGPKSGMPNWWPALMDAIPKNEYSLQKTFSVDSKTAEYLKMIQEILKTVEVYRRGQRPPAAALVPLKQRLICVLSRKRFRKNIWELWTNDDRLWRERK